MSFHPGRAAEDAAAGLGAVDFRLQRRRTLSDYRAGRLAASDVCDAHPELMRVARNCAVGSAKKCPVCDSKGTLSSVHYVFGPRLPASGKLALTEAEMDSYLKKPGDYAAYEVEVCASCGWNHLIQRIPLRP